METVDAVIRARLNSDVVLIRTIGEYIIGAGGKRMRPVLLLLVAQALGYKGNHHHLMAAAVEFIHTATLLHDDVVDESDLRRGRGTANAVFGNAASVLVGDYLYSRAFEMMVDVDSMRIMQIMSGATTVIAEGEVLQLLNIHDPDVSEARYLQVVRFKTAKLFEAAAEAGAVLAGASSVQQEAAAAYGRHIGTAFQLVDDVLDYNGDVDVLGKNVGDDLREGKPTPLMAIATEHANASELQVLQLVGHARLTDAQVTDVQRVIRETGALSELEAEISNKTDEAIAAIQQAPITDVARDELIALASYVSWRSV